MANWRQLTDSLVELSLHRTLRGFEQALGRVWNLLSVDAWAVFLPPSFQAGDRQLFVGQAVRPAGPLLTKAAREGIESLTTGGVLAPGPQADTPRHTTPRAAVSTPRKNRRAESPSPRHTERLVSIAVLTAAR